MSPLDIIHFIEAYQDNIHAIAMIGSVFLTFFASVIFSINLHFQHKDKADSNSIIEKVRYGIGSFFIALFFSYLAFFYIAGLLLKVVF